VVRHVYDPAGDTVFRESEAEQTEKTLLHFLPLLKGAELSYGVYCASLAACASALFCFYSRSDIKTSFSRSIAISDTSLAAMQPIATIIANYAARCYASDANYNCETASPFVPLSLYQAAAVHLHIIQQRQCSVHAKHEYEEALGPLKTALMNFAKRWAIAGK
jgi:hypothetical protein